MKKFGTLLMLVAIVAVAVPTLAQDQPFEATPLSPGAAIAGDVDIGLDRTSVAGAATDLELVSIIVTLEDGVELAALEAAGAGKLIYRYEKMFNGVSMILPVGNLDAVASMKGVKRVYLDELVELDTDESPAFIGAPVLWEAVGGQEFAGEGIVVGVVDSGIWPEHPSFSDPDPSGKPYDAPPFLPGHNGVLGDRSTCDFGNTDWNPNDAPFDCNNKLIGAYRFQDTAESLGELTADEFKSARDSDGHGTHTTSTAAGNAGVEASILGTSFGAVSGIAPRASVIMYRTAWGPNGTSYFSDLTAAVEQATLDGVDVLNYSIGGGTNPFNEGPSLAFLAAYENGVFVSCSAGNSGPGADTVGHREPWVTTVAASTQSRTFEGYIHIDADNADTLDLVGVSIGGSATGELVLGADYGDPLCGSADGVNPFAPGTFTSDQIVVCERGIVARVEKSGNVQAAGGGGMILYNPAVQTLNADNHFVPTVHIDNVAGQTLLDFMGAHAGETVTLTGGVKVFGQGDVMAAFSSRGGSGQSLGISKPDVTAPGVNILAGHSPMPAFPLVGGGGAPGNYFQAIGGTSMSAPHVTGAAALLKQMHPDWTPGQIRSALMMTALTDGVVKEDAATPADPFDMGSGRIDLTEAGFAGLTISATAQDFVDLENELWNANYPSLYVPVMPGRITVQRTVHNETNLPRNWKLTPVSTPDVTVIVPMHIQVPADGDATFDITVDARDVPLGEVRHATIEFKQGNEDLHFPVTIVRQQPEIELDKVCEPAQLSLGGTTECTITVENTSYDRAHFVVEDQLPDGLSLIDDSLVGAHRQGKNGLAFTGWLEGATPGLQIDDTVPLYGYVPLADYGFTPIPPPINPDDGGYLINDLDFWYQNVHYTDGIWSVNGTLQIGTADGYAASASNRLMPDPTIPNNLLAAWWTDLDLTHSGNWYLGALSDGVYVYDIFEWENVPRYGDPASTAAFQIWLRRGTNYAWFTYGGFTGDVSDGTVGAENADGTVGDTYYYGEGGVGVVPAGDLLVDQNSGASGEAHVITFAATGVEKGPWQNCAEMTSDLFFGTNVACAEGVVTK